MELLSFLPLIIIMGAFMFFASRRQRKAMQATVDLQESLRVGDRVHTTSGLQATIARPQIPWERKCARPAGH